MYFENNKPFRNRNNDVVTMKSVTRIRNKDSGVESITIQVYEDNNNYLSGDLTEMSDEEYQQYLMNDFE
jgi:hypothetical protein